MIDMTEQMRQENNKLFSLFRKWQRAWDILKAESVAEKPDPAVMEECAAQLSGWVEYFHNYQNSWQELRASISKSYLGFMQKYEGELRAACNQLSYFVEGEFPSLTINGLIKVRLDKDGNAAIVNGKKTPSLSIKLVVERIQAEQMRLWEHEIDLPKFLTQLHMAYHAICQEKSIREGEYVYLREIFQHIKVTEKNYLQDLFAADISRLLENSSLLTAVDIAPVKDPNKAIYIYDRKSHTSRYIGLIRFR